MRKLIILGAAASLLTVAACNRATETAAPVDEAPAASDTGSDAASTGSASGSWGGGAPAPADTVAPYPTNDPMAPAPDGPGPVTDATRDGAKEKAETTNLHPKPN